MVEKITNFCNKMCDVLMYIASCFMIGAFLLIFIQVVLRYMFSTSIQWAEEAARYLIIAAMCLGISVTSNTDKLPGIDIFHNRLNPKFKCYVDYVFFLVIFWISGTMVFQGIKVTISRINLYAITFGMSMAYIYAFIPICGFLLMFTNFVKFINYKKKHSSKMPH